MPAKPFKFVILSDIHYGSDKPRDGKLVLLPSRALSLVRYFVNRINAEIKPNFVMQLGSSIEDEDEEEDEENYSTILTDALKPLTMPVYHAVGSTEQVNLSHKKIESILKYQKLYYSFDVGIYHFVVLFADSTQAAVHIDEYQRKWLQNDLHSTDKRVILFSHHPLDEQDLTDNERIEPDLERSLVAERVEIREIIARSGKVKAVFSCHTHMNNLQSHDDIFYVSLQSLIANMSKNGKTASESIAVVTLTDAEIRVEIEGLDQAEYRFASSG